MYSCIDHTTKMLGPGYYNLGESLVKKSYNVRVSSGNTVRSKPRGGNGNSGTSPSSSSPQQQRNRMHSEEYSSGNNSAAHSPRKIPQNEQIDSDAPKRNVLRGGGSNSASASPAASSYSRRQQDERQYYVYETPT